MRKLQKEIIKKFGLINGKINIKFEINRIINFIKKFIYLNKNLKSLILGVSGGQDSTLVGCLIRKAINELKLEGILLKFICILMPYSFQQDWEFVKIALKFIKPDILYNINIKKIVDNFILNMMYSKIKINNFLKCNIKARQRMIIQYTIANKNNGIVIGTSNAVERVIGFNTKFGDNGNDILPIAHLNKRQGRLFLKKLNVSKKIFMRKPIAGLDDYNQMIPDEKVFGLLYKDIDDYLEGKYVKKNIYLKIEKKYLNNLHKILPSFTILDI